MCRFIHNFITFILHFDEVNEAFIEEHGNSIYFFQGDIFYLLIFGGLC